MTTGRSRSEEGVTLVEVAVVVMLMGIIGFMMLNFLDSTSTVVSRSSATAQTETSARLVLRSMLQDIRAAESISQTYPSTSTCPAGGTYPSGYATCIQFNVPHTNSTSATCPYSKLTYGLVNGVLKEDRVDYNGACSASTIFTGKVILSNITNSTRPLFTFTDRFGNLLSTSTGTNPSFAAASTVRVQLYLRPLRSVGEFDIFSTAALRNNR